MKLTLTKKLLGLLNEMSRVDRSTPIERVNDLQKLEIILSKFLLVK